ncbi:MAG: putative beta-lysine N-acetyltransferase [Phycisphaeraceae bacterium JB051]
MTDTTTIDMQTDTIENIGHSTIQHGKMNDRVYLMKLDPADRHELPEQLVGLAKAQGYSKIFTKIPGIARQEFAKAGFALEASIPGFYQDKGDALFMSRFLADKRRKSAYLSRNSEVLEACRSRRQGGEKRTLPDGYTMRLCTEADVNVMAQVYAEVFPTYPFAIDDPAYLLETMKSHVAYFGVWNQDGKLVALASSEMDRGSASAEMTDFATLPEERGKALATVLLHAMEDAMPGYGIKTAYTIARAPSFGMNITFARMGYIFGGQLINNTNIAGGFEDMNVWYKTLL